MFEIELLGTGSAAQVPVWGCDCIACERARVEPQRRRHSASLALHTPDGVTLVDAGLMDLAERFRFETIRRVLLTHFHMDHVQGLFPLRWSERAERIPVYRPDDPQGCDDLYKYPGVFAFQPPLQPFSPLAFDDFTLTALPLHHSRPTFGYLIDLAGGYRVAYLTDTVGLPEETRAYLAARTPQLVLLDCSEPPREPAPRNHNDLTRALQIHRQLGAGRTILTHIGHRLDSWLLTQSYELPAGVELGRDGQRLRCPPC